MDFAPSNVCPWPAFKCRPVTSLHLCLITGPHTIYVCSRLFFYIGKYVCKSMLNKRRITLPAICCRPFAWKAVFLSGFERFWVRRLLFLILIKGQGRNPYFERAPAQERFFPENHIAPHSNFAAKRSKDSRSFSYLLIENPSKRPEASPGRKLKSYSFWTVKMRSKLHTCQWEIVPLIASFWLDVINQMV